MNSLKENLLRKIIRNEIKSILNENEQPLTEMASFYSVTDPEEFEKKLETFKSKGLFKPTSTMGMILQKLADEGQVDYKELAKELGKSDIASFNNPNTRKYLEGQGLEDMSVDFSTALKPGYKSKGKTAGKTDELTKAISNLSPEQKAEMMKMLGLGGAEETNEAQEIKEFLQFKKWKNRLK
jgi:hypothetical protein